MTGDFLITARWGAFLDWILFSGAVAFTLAALVAFRLGSPRVEQSRNVNWLFLAGASALAAVGMALPLAVHLDARASGVLFAITLVLGIAGTGLVILMARGLGCRAATISIATLLSLGLWSAIGLCVVWEPLFPAGEAGGLHRSAAPIWTATAASTASAIGLVLCVWINLRHLESLPDIGKTVPRFSGGSLSTDSPSCSSSSSGCW